MSRGNVGTETSVALGCIGTKTRASYPPSAPHRSRLLGVKTEKGEKGSKVKKLEKGEVLMLNIGSMCTGARVVACKSDLAKVQLTMPVCTTEGEKIALSRRVEKHWRLIGWGQIQKGLRMQLPDA